MTETPIAAAGEFARRRRFRGPARFRGRMPPMMMVMCPLFFAAQLTFVTIMLRRTARIERTLKALAAANAAS